MAVGGIGNHLASNVDAYHGGGGAALMAAAQAQRTTQHFAAHYRHPHTIPPAYMVGRPGDPAAERQAAASQRMGGAFGAYPGPGGSRSLVRG